MWKNPGSEGSMGSGFVPNHHVGFFVLKRQRFVLKNKRRLDADSWRSSQLLFFPFVIFSVCDTPPHLADIHLYIFEAANCLLLLLRIRTFTATFMTDGWKNKSHEIKNQLIFFAGVTWSLCLGVSLCCPAAHQTALCSTEIL